MKNIIKCKIVSDSMHPLIKVNETVHLTTLSDYTSITPFTIIVFWSHDKYICHFFWKMTYIYGENYFLTKSLQQPNEFDLPIKAENILGIVQNKKISLYQRLIVYFKCIIRL